MAAKRKKKRTPQSIQRKIVLNEKKWAEVKDRYEKSDDTVAKIARDCGITTPTIMARARRLGWNLRQPKKSIARPLKKALAEVDQKIIAEASASRLRSMRKLYKAAEKAVGDFAKKVEAGEVDIEKWKDLEPALKAHREAAGMVEGKSGGVNVENMQVNNKFGLNLGLLSQRPERPEFIGVEAEEK